jgi:hypothetical protein
MLPENNLEIKLKCAIGEIETNNLKVFVDLYWLCVDLWLDTLDGF